MDYVLKEGLRFFTFKGVKFVDISTLLENGSLLNFAMNKLHDVIAENVLENIDYVVSPEARGFIFGVPMAMKLSAGFIPVRKEGKLPKELCIKGVYKKEYEEDVLYMPDSKDYMGKNFLIVDDVYATGGTAKVIEDMIKKAGGNFLGTVCYINLPYLNNDDIISAVDINYDNDDPLISYNI